MPTTECSSVEVVGCIPDKNIIEVISNSQCCSIKITQCLQPSNTAIYKTYSTTIHACNTITNYTHSTHDSKTTQVPSSPTSMTISETPLDTQYRQTACVSITKETHNTAQMKTQIIIRQLQ